MAEAFIYPLILAVLGGAAYIAYRHPAVYAGLYRYIAAICILLTVFAAGFIIGGQYGRIPEGAAVAIFGWLVAAFGAATVLRLLKPYMDVAEKKADKRDR